MKCKRCLGTVVTDPHSGEQACSTCGLVVSEREEISQFEYHSLKDHTPEEVQATLHHGPLQTMLSYGVGGTTISESGLDYAKKPIPGVIRNQMVKISHLRYYGKRSEGIRLRPGLDTMRDMGQKLSLSQPILERAAYIYKHAYQKNLSIGATAAACIYIACRENHVLRNRDDLLKIAGVGSKLFHKRLMTILTELDIQLPIETPERLISLLATKLGLPRSLTEKAIEVSKWGSHVAAGKLPINFAAGCIWYVAQGIPPAERIKKLTLNDLVEAAGVSHPSVRYTAQALQDAAYYRKSKQQ